LQSRDPAASAVLIGAVKAHPSTHLITSNFIMPPVVATLEKILGGEPLSKLIDEGRSADFKVVFDQLRQQLAAEERGTRGDG
jgi:hypothetical protein